MSFESGSAGGVSPDAPTSVDLSVTIAAYQEAENLAMLLPVIKQAASALTPSFEVLVLDTQEPMDNTADVCAAHGVRHVPRTGGNTYGDATRTGLREARGRFLLNMDADGSHDPKYFAAMWAQRDNYDLVIGSRYVKGGHTDNPLVLIWMSYVLNLTFRLIFSIRAKDVTNSFRLYRRSFLEGLRLESDNFDILEEILIKVNVTKKNFRIGEIPVTFAKRKAGVSKRNLFQFILGYLATIKKLRHFASTAKGEA